jgi:cytochrome c-type biogenesis protein CcmH/NrfG
MHVVAAFILCAMSSEVVRAEEGATERAIQLANQGKIEAAIDVLRGELKQDGKNVKARLLLGRILDFDGRPDEAVDVWRAGLKESGSGDFMLLMAIGEIRARQGEDGPSIVRRRGTFTAMPTRDEAGETKFKAARLGDAAEALEKACKLRPDDSEAAKTLANVYLLQSRPAAAAEIWRARIVREPDDASNHLALGAALKQAGRPDDAGRAFEKAIELNPRLAEAHRELAEYQKGKGQVDAAALSKKRAEFYAELPPFSTLEYSDENVKLMASLNDRAVFEKLIADISDRSNEVLAILCWSHPHNRFETEAFEALEARGAGTTPLLRAVLANAHSTCTIKSAAHILARRRAEGIFGFLAQRLPGDVRGFGMDMDLAGSLDDLGDPRAVAPLVQLLDPESAADAPDLMTDRTNARARAALALGAFDTPESRRALELGVKNPRLSAYCLAALHRLSHDPKHLAALEKTATGAPEHALERYLIGQYLVAKVQTPEAKALAARWAKERAAEEAAEEKSRREKP